MGSMIAKIEPGQTLNDAALRFFAEDVPFPEYLAAGPTYVGTNKHGALFWVEATTNGPLAFVGIIQRQGEAEASWKVMDESEGPYHNGTKFPSAMASSLCVPTRWGEFSKEWRKRNGLRA